MDENKTQYISLIGNPVEHSVSAEMHNAVFRKMGLDYIYSKIRVMEANLKYVICGAKSIDMKGFNVTLPYKQKIIPYLDEVDDSARMIGAVNTITIEDGVAKGYNTDGLGAVRAFNEVESVKDKKLVVLGSGGASRAICFQSCIEGIGELVIVNRTVEKAEALVDDIVSSGVISGEDISFGGLDDVNSVLDDSDFLMNTTRVGMYPNVDDEPLVGVDGLHSGLVVQDAVFNPLCTNLLKLADSVDARTVSGVKMLVYQGAESLRLWLGIDAPCDLMEDVAVESLLKY